MIVVWWYSQLRVVNSGNKLLSVNEWWLTVIDDVYIYASSCGDDDWLLNEIMVNDAYTWY